MTLSKKLVAAAVMTLLIGVPAADAQRRGGSGGGQSRGGNVGGGQARGGSGAGLRAGPRSAAPRAAPPRVYNVPRWGANAPRSYSSGSYSYRAYSPRPYSYGAWPRYGAGSRGGVVVGRAVPRVYGFGGFRGTPVRFYQPYYSFRPRLSFGFGLRVGYPIAYPYSYGYYNPYYAPYGYSYSYSNPYPYSADTYSSPSPSYPAYPPSTYPQSAYPPSAYPPESGSVSVQPGQDHAEVGGLSFEITPATAQVFVDGSLVGTVGDFTPMTRPLGLTPGRHRIEIRAPGFQSMDFDADIVAGQVIPYQAAMQR